MAKSLQRKHEHPPKGMITAADLLAGAVMPMKLTLNVTIRPGMRGHEDDHDPDCPHPPRRPMVEDRLSKYTPKVLEWAKKNHGNAAMLLTDPQGAAARSGVKLSRADARALEQHVHAAGMSEVLPAGVELVALDVKVAGDQRPPRMTEREAKKETARRTR